MPFDERRESWNGRVDAVEERRLFRRRGCGRHERVHQQIALQSAARRQREQPRHRLALVHPALFGADLDERPAEQRIERRHVEGRRLLRAKRQRSGRRRGGLPTAAAGASRRVVVLARLPRHEPIADLFRIARCIARGLECFAAEQSRRLMMQAAAGADGIHPDDDIGARHADQPDVIADDFVPSPLLHRLFDAERVTEVDRAGEILLGRVEPMHRFELSGSQHCQWVVQLGPDLVLPAVASCRGRQNRAHALPAIQVHVQRVVLVVGMGGRLHEHRCAVELAQDQAQRDGAILEIDRTHAQLRVRRR